MAAGFVSWPTFWPGASAKPEAKHPAQRVAPCRPAPVRAVPARPLRGLREARDAVAVVSLLREPMTIAKAEILVDRLVHHRTRMLLRADANPLLTLVGAVPNRFGDAMMRYVAPVLVDVVLPGARDYLMGRLVDGRRPDAADAANGEAMPGAVEVADAMRRIVRALKGAGRGHLATVADACEAESRRLTEQHYRDTRPTGPASLHDLAHALLRVEVLTLVLDALGSTAGLDEGRYQSRRLARLALRRATEALEGFVADRGLKALHASLSVLAAVDALIVVVLRILDARQETREEASPFVEPADRVDMGKYVQAAGRLSSALLDMVGRAAVTPKLDDLFFEALVRQIAWLHRFCAHLGHEDKPPALTDLQHRLVDRSARLAGYAGDALIDTIMQRRAEPHEVDTLVRRTEAIAELLLDMDRPDELEALALRIVVVREALGEVLGGRSGLREQPGEQRFHGVHREA
ncbi:hypothetical protein HL658_26930 [Azospirillum sp. RWY-5-1]|uniref:Uncharacterized protein n=1 Tax=Azospirillum oleiclasticum TaxID=2735135 RepID=A0ABX2TKK6_9PROT|nr:hypothetical protein [Azospirillum oleiclasticum]NYZ16191.1 hypothetical protein [Azospirillum oleiclasticum]NYZ23678.1 hypothetical protein [Azospirillum oleiclasticum]